MRTEHMRSPIAALVPALVLLVVAAAPARAADLLPVARGEPLADPAHATTVYLPVLSAPSRSTEGQELWRSDDAGATFHPVLGGAPFDPHESHPPPAEPPAAVAGVRRAARGLPRRHAAALDGRRRDVERGAGPRRVSALAFGPAAPVPTAFAVVATPPILIEGGRRLAAAPGDGLYRLDGDRWRRVLAGEVVQVVPHPTDASRVYAITSELMPSSVFVDGGATFRRVAARRPLLRLVVDAARPDRLLGMDDEDAALLRSTDAGATWTRTTALPLEPQALAQPVPAAPARVLVAAGDNEPEEPSLLASDDFRADVARATAEGADVARRAGGQPRRPDPHLRPHPDQPPAGGHRHERRRCPPVERPRRAARRARAGRDARCDPVPAATRRRRRGATARAHPVRLAPDEGAYVEGVVRLVARMGGRDATIGSGFFESDGGHAFVASVRIGPRIASRLRAARRVDGLVRISATDDTEVSSTRWERLTIDAGG